MKAAMYVSDGAGVEPRYREIAYESAAGESVLNALERLEDEAPAFSFSCRNACCGACGMMLDDAPVLACRAKATDGMKLAPLRGLPVRRDLLADRSAYDARLRDMLAGESAPQRIRTEADEPRYLSVETQEKLRTASRCIGCLLCLSVCPAFTGPEGEFAGPCAYVRLARKAFDPRTRESFAAELSPARLAHCIACGRCSRVCPAEARPAETIRLLMRQRG